jgi:hypothetical protein
MNNSFKAAVWNVFAGTPTDRIAKPLDILLNDYNVGIFYMTEAGGNDINDLLYSRGLKTYAPELEMEGALAQYRLAWNPSIWTDVFLEGILLSDIPYKTRDGKTRLSAAARAILCDKWGRSLDAVCYHTPAHIQVPVHDMPQNRWNATVESFETLSHLASDTECRAFLSGGDDNVDELEGLGGPDRWAPMLEGVTGLRQVRAPEPTFGKRKIDDYRVGNGLKVGRGWVIDSNATEKPAHKIHIRNFMWS